MRGRIVLTGVLTLVIATAAVLVTTVPGLAEPPYSPQIVLRYDRFDPLRGEPALPEDLRLRGATSAGTPWLVQFAGPVREEWKAALEQAGARLYDYFPEYAFLVRMDAATAERVRRLEFVRWAGLYHPAYRLHESFRGTTSGEAERVTLQVYPDADLEATRAALEALGGTVEAAWANEWSGYLQATLPAAAIREVARLDQVVWMEPYMEPQLFNDVARGIMNVPPVWQNLGLYGSGQIVAVADTGLDTGNESTLSADFSQFVKAYALGRPGDWSDDDAHGTHVAGSVLGNGTLSGSNPPAHDYSGSFAGVAPEASLIFQSLLDAGGGLGGIPADLFDLFDPPYTNDGARIHTNSWGASKAGEYDTMAAMVDQYNWGHRDLLILYAAANSGKDADANGVVDPDSIGSPGTSKNALTVGASENLRTEVTDSWGDWWPSDFPADPIYSDPMANNTSGMAAFSSRGPTDDGRIKPDVTAPGAWIISARSHDPNAGTGWGVYNDDYLYMGGTSMATPLTAGMSTLVREWLVEVRGETSPSAALIKALVLNGSAEMSPGQYGPGPTQEIPDERPNGVEGWGRADLKASILPDAPRQVWYDDYTAGLSTGQTRQYQLSVGVPLGGQAGPGTGVSAPPPVTHLAAGENRVTVVPSLVQRPPAGRPQGTTMPLLNAGFEDGVWTPWQTIGAPLLDNTYAHGGIWSAYLGGYNSANDWIYQAVDIPWEVTDVTFDFWFSLETLESYQGYDFFCYALYDQTGLIAYVERCMDFAQLGNMPWTEEVYSLSPSELLLVAGETVLVAFYVQTDSLFPSGAWVDDIALYVTTPDATPTPTPTLPTATPTPGGPTVTPSPTPPPGAAPLRIALVWTDYPGQPSSGRALVNDLDLEVIDPNGVHHYGNEGVYAAGHPCLRSNQWDQCNNAEEVYLAQAAPGEYTVIVHGYNIPQGPQPFAITVWGDYVRPAQEPTPTPTLTPTPGGPTATPTLTPTPGGPTPTATTPPAGYKIHLPAILKDW